MGGSWAFCSVVVKCLPSVQVDPQSAGMKHTICVRACVRVYTCLRDVHMCAGAVTGHNKESCPLGLLLQVGVSCWVWVVEPELWSSARAASV